MSTNRYIDKIKARLAKEAGKRMQLQALLDDQVARSRALLAERDALKKDAERYRYLRNEAWGCDKNKRDDMHVVLIGAGVLRSGLTELAEEALDTAIDAALQGAQP